MTTRTNVAIKTFLILTMLAFSSAALAKPEKNKKADFALAKKSFKAGQKFLKQKKYKDAIVNFRKAYKITGDGLVMGQIALTYEKAGDYEMALETIKIYRDALPAEERTGTDDLIKKYGQLIASGKSRTLKVPGEREKYVAKEKDALAAAMPPEPTPPPGPAMIPEKQTPATPAPAPAPMEPALTPAPTTPSPSVAAAPLPAPVTPAPPASAPPKNEDRFYTWIFTGAAAALGVGALVMGITTKNKYDSLEDECKPNCKDSEVNSLKTRALVTDILAGGAVAAGITALVLYFVEGGSETSPNSGSNTAPVGGSDDFSRRINFTPVVGAGTYGLQAGLRF